MTKEVNVFGGDENLAPPSDLAVQNSEDDQVVDKQWSAYTRARDAGHLIWVREARKYDEYYYGDQWEDDIRSVLNEQKRPAHTVNLVLSTVNALVGEYIKTRQDISFSPAGKGASQDAANSLRFLFKQIAINNKTQNIEKTIFLDGLIQDRGYFYYYLDFSDNRDGEIREMHVDPTDVILDPGAKDYDPRTWSEVFISRWMTPDEIGAVHGVEFRDKVDLAGAGTFGHDSIEWEAPNFSGDHYNSEQFFQSKSEEMKKVKRIRVIERQHKTLARTQFFMDNETGDQRRVPEGWTKEKAETFARDNDLVMLWKPERRIRVTITADKVLLHDEWSLFNQISIIPFFPYFRRGRPFGVVRNLISPQDMLNKVTSQELHVVNTTANSGWTFETGSLINMDRDDLVTQGAQTGLVLEYNTGAQPPEKITPNSVPVGLAEIGIKAGTFFREISGVNEAQLGTVRSDSSKALAARRATGSLQQEIIFDNLDFTRQLRAELMLEIVQNYYTETRLLQVFSKNEDGEEEQSEITVNQPMAEEDEMGNTVRTIKNDLTLGEYSVVITNVPRRETYDEVLFEQLFQMREVGVQIPDYMLVEASSLPNREEAAQVVKEIQGMAAPTEEEVARANALADLELRLLTAEVMEKEAQATERQANAQKLLAEAGERTQKPEVEKLRIGTEARTELEKANIGFQQNREDLQTRIRIASGKESTMRDLNAVESMTARNIAGVRGRVDLQKEILKGRKASETATKSRSTSKSER